MANNRVFYGCYGIAYCGEPPLQGARSISITTNRQVTNIFTPGSKDAIASYTVLPDIELTFTSYLTAFPDLTNEPGVNDYTSLDVTIGDETDECLSPKHSLRFKYLFLTNFECNMSVDGVFTIQRTFKGWTKHAGCSPPGAFTCTEAPDPPGSNAYSRQKFDLSGSAIPAFVKSASALQSITASCSINRQYVPEFATRKPYASYITFPIENSCKFETIIKDSLDGNNLDFIQNACKNTPAVQENISLQLCGGGGSFDINNAYFTSSSYSGADAGDKSNLKASLSYIGYNSDIITSPVVIIPDNSDDCTC